MTHREQLDSNWDDYVQFLFGLRTAFESDFYLEFDHHGQNVGVFLNQMADFLDALDKHQIFAEVDGSSGQLRVLFATEKDRTAARLLL